MSYIENNLVTGETLVHRGRLHWVIFLWPIIWLLVAIGSAIYIGKYGLLVLILAVITGLASFIRYKTSAFGITSKRVIVKVGFIRINSIEVLLNKVEGIQVNQDIPGRILGYGSITITGTGGTRDPFHTIAAPFEFRKRAQEQIAKVQDLQ